MAALKRCGSPERGDEAAALFGEAGDGPLTELGYNCRCLERWCGKMAIQGRKGYMFVTRDWQDGRFVRPFRVDFAFSPRYGFDHEKW